MSQFINNTRFFLYFGATKTEIAEPVGFDASQWILRQETGRYGRDESFSPEKMSFRSSVEIMGLTHQFDALVQEYNAKGFEGDVKFGIEIQGVEYVLGQLDFSKAETDLIKYFDVNIIQLNDEVIVKRRMDVKVDLYSDEAIMSGAIDPLVPKKILIKAQPLIQESAWRSEQLIQTGNLLQPHFNFIPRIEKSEIKDTLSPLFGFTTLTSSPDENFILIEAKSRLTKTTFALTEGHWEVDNNVGQNFEYVIRKGIVWNGSVTNPNDIVISLPDAPTNFSVTIDLPIIENGEKLWGWFRNSGVTGGQGVKMFTGKVSIKTTSISYSSLTDGVRLIDAMKQTVKSISGLDVVAPRFDEGGEHYDQYIFKGNQIRLINDKPFTLSFEDCLKYLPEVNCDYQVNSDGTVFIGHETDFYTDESAGVYPISPNSTFKTAINDRFTYNKIRFAYDKYEKGENDLQKDALFGVNTEFEMVIPNEFVEDTKDIKVGFIRDAYRIEKTRRDSIMITENAPTRDDEDVIILDVIENNDLIQAEVFILNHSANISAGTLSLFNNGSFNWELIGFFVGFTFTVDSGENIGVYTVTDIDGTKMESVLVSGTLDFNGVALTRLVWTIQSSLTNRTNEGFFPIMPEEVVDGITNLKYAAKRNLQKYWRGNIKAAAQFYPGGTIKNTFFRNGAGVIAQFMDEPIFTSNTQDRDFLINLLGNPILSAYIVETEIIVDFGEFWEILTECRANKKYIEVANTKENIIKLHPMELAYNFADKLLTIKGEKRWEF